MQMDCVADEITVASKKYLYSIVLIGTPLHCFMRCRLWQVFNELMILSRVGLVPDKVARLVTAEMKCGYLKENQLMIASAGTQH